MPLSTLRPWITAGVALAGANVIVAGPVLQTMPARPELRTQEVQLTDTASNFTDNVLNPFLYEPVPALQQVVVNGATYLSDIFHDVTNVSPFGTDLTSLVNDFTSINWSDPSTIISDLSTALNTTFAQFGTDATNYFDAFGTTFSTIGTDITNNATAALNAPISFFEPDTSISDNLLPSLSETPFNVGFSIGGGVVVAGTSYTITFSPTLNLGTHADLLKDLVNGLPIKLDLGDWNLTVAGVNIFSIPFPSVTFPCVSALTPCLGDNVDILSLLLGSTTADTVRPWLEFAGSPLSGVLSGLVTTTLSPLAGLTQDAIAAFNALDPLTIASDFTSGLASATTDLTNVGTDFTDAFNALLSFDFSTAFTDLGNVGTDLTSAFDAFNPLFTELSSTLPTALSDLSNIPGDMVNDFFNGFGNAATLLSDLGIPTLGLQLDLGGLLSQAGSAFNIFGFDINPGVSVDLTAGGFGFTFSGSGLLTDAAEPVGPLASLVEMGQSIAEALGWDGTAGQLADLASLF